MIKVKIVGYAILSILIQYAFNVITGTSGGGIAVVCFVVFDKLDTSFSVIAINDKKKMKEKSRRFYYGNTKVGTEV